MDNSITTTIEKLFDKTESYAKTSIAIGKLTLIQKIAEIASKLSAKGAVVSVVIMSLLFGNIGLALWVGDLLQSSYLGFFAVAGLYLFLAIFLYVFRKSCIENPVSASVIISLKKDLIS